MKTSTPRHGFHAVALCAGTMLVPGAAVGSPGTASDPITFETLLEEMTSREALARWPSPVYYTGQFSSYDRRSVTPDDPEGWFANRDRGQFIRSEDVGGRTEYVMAEIEGPGAITRIWSANPAGTIRFYLDGSDEPTIEAPMVAFVSGGKVAPDPISCVRGLGHNLYLPIPFADGARVTSDFEDFYYHVNYRAYEAGTVVETIDPDELGRGMDRLERVVSKLTSTEVEGERQRAASGRRIGVGDYLDIDLPEGSHAVRELRVRVDTDGELERALRSVVLQMHFDGDRTVWTPVGDFFGSGIGLNPLNDWMRTVGEDGRLTARWVMPYERSAELRLHNLSPDPVRVDVTTRVTPWEWDDRSMHFHATWRQERGIPTRPYSDWNYVRIEGRGVLVGDSLTITNPTHAWWGEGDEKIYIDDESFPAHFGTGTEDYYGYAWCSPQLFEAPFIAQPQAEGYEWGNNYGVTTNARVRALDAIPFGELLHFDMEIWHWRDVEISHAATSMFYAFPGASVNIGPDPDEARAQPPRLEPLPPPQRMEGAVEASEAEVLRRSEGVTTLAQSRMGLVLAGMWSGERQLLVQANRVGDFIELAVPVEEDVPHELTLRATRSWNYGIVQVSVNGGPVGEPMDLFHPQGHRTEATGPIELGVFEPEDGRFVVRFDVVGSNERSRHPGTHFGIDCIIPTAQQ